jgi:hypothetical protein
MLAASNPRPLDHAVTEARHRELGLGQRGRRVRSRLVPGTHRHRGLPSQHEPPAATRAARSGRRGAGTGTRAVDRRTAGQRSTIQRADMGAVHCPVRPVESPDGVEPPSNSRCNRSHGPVVS